MIKNILLALLLAIPVGMIAQEPSGAVPQLKIVQVGQTLRAADLSNEPAALTIHGTGASETFVVSTENLIADVQVSATHGFNVSPTVIEAGSENVTVTVTNLTTLKENKGQVILRSADVREYVKITSYGTELPQKDLSQNPVYQNGNDETMTFEGFAPSENGYTVEVKVKTDEGNKNFYPFAVTADKVGFKGYVSSSGAGLYNSIYQKGLSNPSNGGTFYNTDGLYHTYRYAVTSDKRVIVYRDGILIDTLRTADLALQPEWSVENGNIVENLIKNPGFEGESNYSSSRGITTHIEGWDVSPWDQYNSTQEIIKQERSNEVDQNNHVLSVNRYKWEGGWAAAEISQVVDVAPNETYAFSALAKGGVKSDGKLLGSIRLEDMQNSDNKQVIDVNSDSYQTYGCDFNTKANTKQIRVTCYMERDAWGATISSLQVDDVKLTGVERKVKQQIGFTNNFSDIAYFTFDNTGAYAPLTSNITTSVDTLTLDGTGARGSFTVNSTGLIHDIEVSATHGFSVSPSIIKANSGEVTVNVKNLTTLRHGTGKVILRSADQRRYVQLVSTGTELPQKDLSQNPIYQNGNDEEKTFEGFAPTEKGYTVEFKVKTDEGNKIFYPFAVTKDKVGFKGYVNSSGMGLYNSTSQKGLSNPSNGGTFYNTDGLYHTYRYAVTSDKRVIIYRDGILIDTLRTTDLALQPEWSVETGEPVRNLLKNPGFEGEYNYSSSRGITTHIEGWDVSPWDQYNSTQEIIKQERNNKVDQNNHVLSVDRYMWEAGWAAAEISQIVDVAPNEVYSFSALAKGGVKSDGKLLGSLRIQDMQNSDNKQVIDVTSDSYKTYAYDFETKANTKQIRVTCYMERDAWGASISPMQVDDMKLTGYSRNVKQQIGFTNNFADIAYFTFDDTGAYAPLTCDITTSVDTLRLEGTGASDSFTVNSMGLIHDIEVSATHGFSVSPSIIKANSGEVTVNVKNLTTLRHGTGKVILRSADQRRYVQLVSTGTELPQKDLSQNPVYQNGNDESMTFEGFAPSENGYTVEVKVKTDEGNKNFYPFAVTADKVGFKGYVSSSGAGLYNSTTQKGLSNPSNGGTFYNTDGLYHTYRYAMTSDKRVIVYRDGILIDTLRTADLALQPEWSVENGNIVENLIKNPGFEGESNYSSSRGITTHIEGWDVSPWDQYNSTQDIIKQERSNKIDQNNHVLSVNRYKWEGGWAAAEISQVVDVAPNETYAFSALAKGGVKSDGKLLGSLRIQDMQNSDNKQVIDVTSDSYQTYGCDFNTQANTKQIRVTCYMERDAWGASISPLQVDDVKLTGVERKVKQQIGFTNNFSDIAYFTFDNTGAYAPLTAEIATNTDSIEINGTDASNSFTIHSANLISDIQLSATHGFEVSPTMIKANSGDVTVRVKNLTTLKKNVGRVILRSADIRKYVVVTSFGSELELKDLSQSAVYVNGNDDAMTFEGFAPSENGYTVEVKVKTDEGNKNFYPFAVTADKVGFKGYVSSSGAGLYNSTTQKGLSNPSNGGTFYNTDGLYHTYRYAVTSDKRVIIYRDGILIDTLRTADLALQPEWSVENGNIVENLIKNPGFEGESNYSSSRGITTHIEGWDVSPWDQYNSTQEIIKQERSNEVDQNNHVLSVDRYMWNAGWAAAEISQVVDVAPNETYAFSALAKGGVKSDGKLLGSLRIQDMQNSDNKQVIDVTSDSYQTYGCDFNTQANTKQIRVTCYMERDAWGASISPMQVDDVKLTGVERKVKQQIGFTNNFSDIAYFSFDDTGAYAPAVSVIHTGEPSIHTAIQSTNVEGPVYLLERDWLTLKNLQEGSIVSLYDMSGQLLATFQNCEEEQRVHLPMRGVFIATIVDKNEKKVIKVRCAK